MDVNLLGGSCETQRFGFDTQERRYAQLTNALVSVVAALAAFLCSSCGGGGKAPKADEGASALASCLKPIGTLASGRGHIFDFPTLPTDDPQEVADLGIESFAIVKLRSATPVKDVHLVRTFSKAEARFLAHWGEGGTLFTRETPKDRSQSSTKVRVIRHPERRGVQVGLYALFWSAPPTARQAAAIARCLNQRPSPRVRLSSPRPPSTSHP